MKGYKIRIVIYVAACVLTAVFTYLFKISSIVNKVETKTMSGASLPVVYMISEGGCKYNFLYGNTSEVNYAEQHNVITPIGTDRIMKMGIMHYGCNVSGITYEVRDLSGDKLYEKSQADFLKNGNSDFLLEIKLKNLVNTNEEYMLKINVESDSFGTASYYTRFILADDFNVDRKLNYVRNFSSNTMSDETLKEIIPKLETNSSGDNTNLGHVNIHSKLSQVGFSVLNPSLNGEVYQEINEIDKNTASVTLRYKLKSYDEDRNYEYTVREFYRINQPDEKLTYVYAFDRFMDQIFDPDYAISSSGQIYLGIGSNNDYVVETNEAGNVIAFVVNGNLWTYHPGRDRLNKVFSFDESGSDGYRQSNDNHNIRIMNIDSKGNVNFIVYGYMNRGIHEGKTGMSVMHYDADSNTTEEYVFIPLTESVLTTKDAVDKLAYINKSGVLYFYLNRSIYQLNCDTKECMLIDNGIIPQTCMMSDKKTLVYQTGSSAEDSGRIVVINLENGEKKYIDSKKDEKIKVFGFIDNNIVYGLAKDADIKETGSFVMYELRIDTSELDRVKIYRMKDIFITDVIFYKTKMVIKRALLNEENELVEAMDDQLLSNSEVVEDKAAVIQKTSIERQKEYYINSSVSSVNKANLKQARYVYRPDSEMFINNEAHVKETYYYVFVYGKMYFANTDKNACIEIADKTGGVVVDNEGVRIWDRYMKKKE